jgi:hypothetical protein
MEISQLILHVLVRVWNHRGGGFLISVQNPEPSAPLVPRTSTIDQNPEPRGGGVSLQHQNP